MPKSCEGCYLSTKIIERVNLPDGSCLYKQPYCARYWIKGDYCKEQYIPEYRTLEGE